MRSYARWHPTPKPWRLPLWHARSWTTGEDAKMNMTPMIDMTFLLVVFFMLTIDLTQKEFLPVELPFATPGGREQGPGQREEPALRHQPRRARRQGSCFKGQAMASTSRQREPHRSRTTPSRSLKKKLKSFVDERREAGEAVYEARRRLQDPRSHPCRPHVGPWKLRTVDHAVCCGSRRSRSTVCSSASSVRKRMADAPEIVRPSAPDAPGGE